MTRHRQGTGARLEIRCGEAAPRPCDAAPALPGTPGPHTQIDAQAVNRELPPTISPRTALGYSSISIQKMTAGTACLPQPSPKLCEQVRAYHCVYNRYRTQYVPLSQLIRFPSRATSKRTANLAQAIPKTDRRKIKLKKVACFSSQKTRAIHHIHHAIHHNFTTKTPHPKRTFPKTPLKNTNKTAETAPPHHAQIFSKNYRRTRPVDTGTCSTISIPNPCSAGTCVGVFVSSRIL